MLVGHLSNVHLTRNSEVISLQYFGLVVTWFKAFELVISDAALVRSPVVKEFSTTVREQCGPNIVKN